MKDAQAARSTERGDRSVGRARFHLLEKRGGRRSAYGAASLSGSITRMAFHFPVRNRREQQAAIAKMCAVANHHAQCTLPPARTTSKVGKTMTGQARQNVASVTNRVSPAPRRANAKVTFTASTTEYAATHTSSPG